MSKKSLIQLAIDEGRTAFTARELVHSYGYKRRGNRVIEQIERDLRAAGYRIEPDYRSGWIDQQVKLVQQPVGLARRQTSDTEFRIKIDALPAANKKVLSIKPNETVGAAAMKMMQHDYSQLPVMPNPSTVIGIVSWRSIAKNLILGNDPSSPVEGMIEAHREVASHTPLLDVIAEITRHEHVLVRASNNRINGIVTAADLSLEFDVRAGPFLLISEIEQNIRALLANRFTPEELAACMNSDTVDSVGLEGMTFGAYVKLIETDAHWKRLELPFPRSGFIRQLDRVRVIRNDIVHLNVDALEDDEREVLKGFSRMVGETVAVRSSGNRD